MRKRNHAITIRMEQKEYDLMNKRIKESGQTKQSFIISSVLGLKIASKEELMEIKKLSEICSNNNLQLRGIGTNINQLAKIANREGSLPTTQILSDFSQTLEKLRKEETENWQLIRQLISAQLPTVQ